MTGILKDFNFAIAYLDDIIIFSKTVEEHLDHIKQVFKKLRSTHLSMKLSKCHFFTKEIQYLGHILSMKGIKPLPPKTQAIQNMHPPKMPKQVHAILGLVGYYRKFIKNFAKIAKPLTLLSHQLAKFEWTPTNHNAFFTLKESVIQAPILHYPNSKKCYIVYTDASEDACGAQLSQEHEGTEFLIAFPHIHGYSVEMEHHETRSLQCILHSHKVELLPARSWNNSKKWPQATGKISKWEKCKQSQQMGIRTSHIQHNFWMDIRNKQQSSRLCFTSSGITSV